MTSPDKSRPPIRILHVEAGSHFGGSHRALSTYLRATTDVNLQHQVLLVHPVPEFVNELNGRCPVAILPASRFVSPPSGKLEILELWAEQAWRICTILDSDRFDLVHVNNTFTFQPYTAAACLFKGIPAVVHMRNPVSESRLARLIARTARMIVAQNASLSRSIAHWRIRDVQTCYDGVETGFADLPSARRLREALLGDGDVLIGSVGRLELQKGCDLLVEAARNVVAKHPRARFAIAGEGPLRFAMEKRLSAIGLANRFQLCGFREDVATFLQAIDIFVSCSRYEGGPYTVAEALLSSKPVISTPVGFVPELTRNGTYADLIPIDNVEALTFAINRSIETFRPCRADAPDVRRCVLEFTDPHCAAERLDKLFLKAAS